MLPKIVLAFLLLADVAALRPPAPAPALRADHVKDGDISLIELKPQMKNSDSPLGLIAHMQGPQSTTTTTHQSWFQRMQNAFTQVIIGWILIIFSIPVLWLNERRAARMRSLISTAKTEGQTVEGGKAVEDNRGRLVHLEGEQMTAKEAVEDTQFKVTLESDCLRLQSVVEVFQHIEHKRSEERDKIGGGKETITTYTYTQEWSAAWHDPQQFQDKGNWHTKPEGLDLGSHTRNCGRVEYGGGFLLTEELLNQCCAFGPAESRLEASVSLRGGGGQTFNKGADGHFYFRQGQEAWTGEGAPKVGDARVAFKCVSDGPATVLALQAPSKAEKGRDAFLPYRLITRPWFGGAGDTKERLLQEGRKPKEQLADEDSCGLPCCCCCNLVACCFSSFLTPEINHLFEGRVSLWECFQRVESANNMLTVVLRLVGWLMMFLGLYMTFKPITTFIEVIPFLGPIISKCGSFLIWVFCFLVTVLVATVIVSLAYLFYQPLVALTIFVCGAGVVGLVLLISGRA